MVQFETKQNIRINFLKRTQGLKKKNKFNIPGPNAIVRNKCVSADSRGVGDVMVHVWRSEDRTGEKQTD